MSDRQRDLNEAWFEKHVELHVEKLTRSGSDELLMCSPLREDHSPSFSVNLEKGCWNDFATHEGGTLTDLAGRLGVPAPEYAVGGTSSPRKEQDAKAEAENTARAEAARAVWDMSVEEGVSTHEYLKAKQLDATGLNLRRLSLSGPALPKPYQKISRRGQLIVPVRDAKTDQLVGVELIDCFKTDSKWVKRDLGVKEAGYWEAGTCSKKDVPLVFCEGMATAATVKRFVGDSARAICCFGAGNVPIVAAAFSSRFPKSKIIVATDADSAGEAAFLSVVNGEYAEDPKTGRKLKAWKHEPIPDALEVRPPKKASSDGAAVSAGLASFRDAQGLDAVQAALWSLDARKAEARHDDWNDVACSEGDPKAAEVFASRLYSAQFVKEYLSKDYDDDDEPLTDMSTLTGAVIPERYYAVENTFPQGLTILEAPPKSGKSWLCLQACAAVAKGAPFLGMKTTKSKVLYIDFEDDGDGITARWNAIGGDVPKDQFMHRKKISVFDQRGLTRLANLVLENKFRFVIVDMWAQVKPPSSGKENAYMEENKIARPIKAIADLLGIALVLVHHERKYSSGLSIIEAGSGSQGLPGAADSVVRLMPPETGLKGEGTRAVLSRTGRRVRADDTPLVWTDPGWRRMTADEVREKEDQEVNSIDRAVFQTLTDKDAPASTKEVIAGVKKALTGQNVKQPSESTIRSRLTRLVQNRELERCGRGSYWFPVARPLTDAFEEATKEEVPSSEEETGKTQKISATIATSATSATIATNMNCCRDTGTATILQHSSNTDEYRARDPFVANVAIVALPDEGFPLRGNASYECPEGYIPANQEVTI